MQLIATDVALSAVSVCWALGVQKRLNQMRCRLWGRVMWARGTFFIRWGR